MRWVVYALLAANLALLTWNLQTRGAVRPVPEPAPAVADARSPEEARTLPLLTEFGRDSLRQRTAEGADAPAGSPPGSSPPAATTGGPGGLPAPAPEAPAPVVAAVTPPDVDTAPGATGGPAPARSCLTVGPLDDKAPVAEIQSWLEARGAEADVRTDERREVATYWIYFPPRASRADARAELDRIRAAGIQDVVLVPRGDMAGAISLGVFSSATNRDRRLKELDAKGYQPLVVPRYRTKLATWVDVTADAGALPDAELQQKWPDIEIARKPCGGGQIAAARAGSYNPGEPAPTPARRFYFSGQPSEQQQPPGTRTGAN